MGTATTGDLSPVANAQRSDVGISSEYLRSAVLKALGEAGHDVLAHNLEEGEWSLQSSELSVRVGISQMLIDVALGPAPKRIIEAELAKAMGRPLRFKMTSAGMPITAKPAGRPRANGTGARSRAQADPVVQRMQEKFGAEIRTVIDQKDNG
jgi:hypothetical protein